MEENDWTNKRIKYVAQGRNGQWAIDLKVEGETGVTRNVLISDRISGKLAQQIANELNAAYVVGYEQGKLKGSEDGSRQ